MGANVDGPAPGAPAAHVPPPPAGPGGPPPAHGVTAWLEKFPAIIAAVKDYTGLTALLILAVMAVIVLLVLRTDLDPGALYWVLLPGLLLVLVAGLGLALVYAVRMRHAASGPAAAPAVGDGEAHADDDADPPAVLRRCLGERYQVEDAPFHDGDHTLLYRGFDACLERGVAVKWLKANDNPHHFHDFARSCRTAIRVADLPNFLSIYEGWLKRPDRCFIVMQLVQGRDLRQVIERSPGGMHLGQVRRVVLGLGDSLVRAHALTATHGNLKPSSILVDDSGEPFLSPRTRLGELHGQKLLEAIETQHLTDEDLTYLAPEELDGAAHAELRDQYLLGLLTYDMLTGGLPPVLPGGGRLTCCATLLAKRSGAFAALPPVHTVRAGVPVRISQILARMLAPDPKRRYATLEGALVQMRRAEQLAFLTARESYARCLCGGGDAFFREFYTRFQQVDGVAAHFEALNEQRWTAQRAMLQAAVNACFDFVQLYPTSTDVPEPNALTAIARSHGTQGRNIDRALYQPFIDALTATVCDRDAATGTGPFDPECADPARRDEIRSAWCSVMTPVVEYMVANR